MNPSQNLLKSLEINSFLLIHTNLLYHENWFKKREQISGGALK